MESDFGPKQEGRSWRFWASLGVIALAVAFIAVNSQEVQVKFLVGDATMPLVFALVIAFALGAALGYVAPKLRRDRD